MSGLDPQNPQSEASDDDHTTPGQAQQEAPLHCAICLDDENENEESSSSDAGRRIVRFVYLPCCGADGREAASTTRICSYCVVLLSTPTGDGRRVGRCPRCRSWIAVTRTSPPGNDSNGGVDAIEIEAVDSAGRCRCCQQVKSHLIDASRSVCDACYLGQRLPLVYECQRCQGYQRIPHPMYRYQAAVDEFGATSWACHGQCGDFTMWRIKPDQVRFIPFGEIPVTWGEDYIQVARERVQEARLGNRQGVGDPDTGGVMGSLCCVS
eukprot:CAMPEP_0113555870 /NCGR_PEP_ID=MMETSP0015_2-20120614/16950_1 /TAXON_ID=2838 /ORGANISM="Odontella" /LENGTH=265 /DNA_ID=CAMNT_0000457181 /DNA_START=88 /DNA_END=885 /DNA_ORIENTATION=+ /assembly_acc=CAM_ASM_000160